VVRIFKQMRRFVARILSPYLHAPIERLSEIQLNFIEPGCF
jgi:hypothetical protein